ncbi:MAG: 50S ribosomal protein L4 [Desulfatiglandaceae bacterium]|jgi:large subunit ribosomal protein L4
MAVVDVHNLQKEKIAEVELKDEIFDVPAKRHVLHQVVIAQLSGRRSGTAATKGRSKVKSSGKKLWRQKGTGRARVGSAASPTRRGGGVAFGPSPRKYVLKVPKKLRKAALRMALSEKIQSEHFFVIDSFDLPEIKTKNFVGSMKHFEVKKALIVTEKKSENLEKSSKNVPWAKVMRYEGLNVYDILKYDHLFLEQSAIGKIEEALAS